MDRIRWGIIGTGNIGQEKVIPAMQKCEYGVVTAIASRDAAKARQVADALGIPQAFGSYEALLADPAIDAVYIPLPNHLHVPWARKALAAGKHVLCEKPIALTAAEAQELLDAAAAVPAPQDHGSVHVSPPPAVAAGPAVGAGGPHRRPADDPILLLLLPR